jgi:hypothetical protein
MLERRGRLLTPFEQIADAVLRQPIGEVLPRLLLLGGG